MTMETWSVIGTGVALGAVILSAMRAMRNDMRSEMGAMRREFEQRFTALEQRFTALEQRFTALEQRMSDIEPRVSKIGGLLEAWLSGAPRPPLPSEEHSRRRA